MIQIQTDAAARPTIRNTPATAPLFLKNLISKVSFNLFPYKRETHAESPPPLSELSVGFTTIWVIVDTSPAEFVDVKVDVNSEGALVVI